MRYSLRTLLVVMLLGGPSLAIAWWCRDEWWMILVEVIVLDFVVLLSVLMAVGCVFRCLLAVVWAAGWLLRSIAKNRG